MKKLLFAIAAVLLTTAFVCCTADDEMPEEGVRTIAAQTRSITSENKDGVNYFQVTSSIPRSVTVFSKNLNFDIPIIITWNDFECDTAGNTRPNGSSAKVDFSLSGPFYPNDSIRVNLRKSNSSVVLGSEWSTVTILWREVYHHLFTNKDTTILHEEVGFWVNMSNTENQ